MKTTTKKKFLFYVSAEDSYFWKIEIYGGDYSATVRMRINRGTTRSLWEIFGGLPYEISSLILTPQGQRMLYVQNNLPRTNFWLRFYDEDVFVPHGLPVLVRDRAVFRIRAGQFFWDVVVSPAD